MKPAKHHQRQTQLGEYLAIDTLAQVYARTPNAIYLAPISDSLGLPTRTSDVAGLSCWRLPAAQY